MRAQHYVVVQWLSYGACMALTAWLAPLTAQALQQPAPPAIQSLTTPGEQLLVASVAPDTGLVTFAASPGGLLLPVNPSQPVQERALQFVALYGARFGLSDPSQVRVLAASPPDALGLEHVKLQQVHQDVPVRGGEFVVHLRGARALAANGHVTNDLPESVVPQIAADVARSEAVRLIQTDRPDAAADARYNEPRLEIFNRGLLSDPISYGTRLAWFIEATGLALREYIWVDAQTGVVLLHFSQLTDAKARIVYNANNSSTLPGTLMRSESRSATGDPDADHAYDYAGFTYDYFFLNYGRDSYDNAGAGIVSSVHYCPSTSTCPYPNAFWNGTQLVYGEGFASADDVVAHELTHAVTEKTANLFHYQQSGALNESFSDIFGETIDLTDGAGNDAEAVRWKVGEDLSGGSLRDMMNPEAHDQPGRMSAPQFYCAGGFGDPDNGGVHSNTGVPNHAFALMVDGHASYNGHTIQGIGLENAGKIWYRALTTYLTSGATFLDAFHAVNQSCADLIGTTNIAAAECAQVREALVSVEMHRPWPCSGAISPPVKCPTGGAPTALFAETFESDLTNWATSSTSSATWQRDTSIVKSGQYAARGPSLDSPSSHQLTMASAVTIPSGARFYFDHAFDFGYRDVPPPEAWINGGVLEFSTDNGASWASAAALIDGGQRYNGSAAALSSAGFVGSSYDYTGTRLTLDALAGQAVMFRFRIASNGFAGGSGWTGFGWAIDNVTLYTCESAAGVPGPPTNINAVVDGRNVAVTFAPPASDGGMPITIYEVTSSPGNVSATGPAGPIIVIGLTGGTTYWFRVTATNQAGTSVPSEPSAPVVALGVPSAPRNLRAVPNAQIIDFGGSKLASWVLLTFERPASDGGTPIKDYTASAFHRRCTGLAPVCRWVWLRDQKGQIPIPQDFLTACVFHKFTVTANNANGSGTPSETYATTVWLPEAPTLLTGARGNGQVTVSFTAPPVPSTCITENSTVIYPITKYTVTASPGGATATGSSSPITVTGLTNGTPYTFTVTATNAYRTGAASAASAAITPATIPQAPGNVSAVRGNGQAKVSFTAPASNGGDLITSYIVTSNPGGVIATGSSSPVTVTGLTNGTSYTFTVAATNGVGIGPPSAASAKVTPATVPGAPTDVRSLPGSAQATVRFTAPSNGGDPITSYTVTASPGGATVTGSGSPITVSGLLNAVTYTFTVTANNTVGAGAASAPSNPVTPTPEPLTPIDFSVSASELNILGTWTAVGGPATSHTLQVAMNASFSPVLLSISLGPDTSFALDAPPGTVGTYFLRIIAINAHGSSVPTAGAAVTLPASPPPPGRPVLNNAVVSGRNVTLNWMPGPGGLPTSYILLVGWSSGASGIAIPMNRITSISAAVPEGTYFVRVQASNRSGSALSDEISFSVGTPCVAPGLPTNATATRSVNVITMNWSAPTTGSAPIAYVIVAGTGPSASNLGTFPIGSATAVSSPVPPGVYFLRVRATNACGVSGESEEVSVAVP